MHFSGIRMSCMFCALPQNIAIIAASVLNILYVISVFKPKLYLYIYVLYITVFYIYSFNKNPGRLQLLAPYMITYRHSLNKWKQRKILTMKNTKL